MNSFVEDLAETILNSPHAMRDIAVVLPGKRSATFLKRAIANKTETATWLPELLTLPDLIGRMVGKNRGDRLDLVFELYETHCKLSGKNESLESFLAWGPTVLSDFNEIDHHLLEARVVFKNLRDYKEIDQWSFGEDVLSQTQEKFLGFWETLLPLYNAFHASMELKNSYYGGALAKKAAHDPVEKFDALDIQHVYVAGLNALTPAEERILRKLEEAGKATVIWDADNYYVHNKVLEAGHFIRKYGTLGNGQSLPSKVKEIERHITITGCSSSITQAQQMAAILDGISEQEAMETAIVLPDNGLLSAVLPAIPEKFNALNVTMGLSVNDSPLRSLIFQFFRLFDTRTNARYQPFLGLIRHPLFRNRDRQMEKAVERIEDVVVGQNMVFIDSRLLLEKIQTFGNAKLIVLFEALFEATKNRTTAKIFEALEYLLEAIEPDDTGEQKDEILYQSWMLLRSNIQRLERLTHQYPVFSEPRELERILFKLLSQAQVDLLGEPLIGLQVMGLLESRALDFKRVIIFSCNEGILPKSNFAESMLPADLRYGFGLPSRHEREAIFAYYFYRLLHRSQDVHLLYVAGDSDYKSGEKSRYLQQIESCALLPKYKTTVSTNSVVSKSPGPAIPIPEFTNIDWIVQRTILMLEKGLYPSAIQKWSACKADFFYRYLLGLREQDELEESMEDNTLGTIVHFVLEEGLKDEQGKQLTVDTIDQLEQRLEALIDEGLSKHYNPKLMDSGENYLKRSIVRKYLEKILQRERRELSSSNTVVLQKLEYPFKHTISVDVDDKKVDVLMGGKADRVDDFNGVPRIIDYKSGRVKADDLEIKYDSWEKDLLRPDHAKALQMLLYMYLAQRDMKTPVMGGIVSAKSHSAGFIPLKNANYNTILHVDQVLGDRVEDWVKKLVVEMLDSNQHVAHNHSAKYCEYCT